jgi:hypothetical protein
MVIYWNSFQQYIYEPRSYRDLQIFLGLALLNIPLYIVMVKVMFGSISGFNRALMAIEWKGPSVEATRIFVFLVLALISLTLEYEVVLNFLKSR